uniref:Reverse transcriptase domain-containing protein n=1 Tax=Nothobranchius furzeri TaxID=105023 RepID=A0A8C6KLF3_NOTFU
MGKLLARQLKEKNNSNAIPVIKRGDEEIYTAKGINNIFQQYYEKLYTSLISVDKPKENIERFLLNVGLPRLKSHETEGLDLPITEAEIRKAIASMKNGKSPGYDRLPVEYYKTFADIVAPILREVYQEMFVKGCVAPTFNEAVISLIPKPGKDPTDPSSYRPISLLNLGCKILTKIQATRLQRVLPNIIHPNQVGFMKNRTSTDNVRLLLHLMWLSQSRDVPIAALSLDAEKAFDRVEWQFLLSTLGHFGFTADFMKRITMLYKEPKAAVMTNGIVSPFFNLTRGTRQGCSQSPLLFIIFLEVLAVSIRTHQGIKGIRVGGNEYELLLYADDILAVLSEP